LEVISPLQKEILKTFGEIPDSEQFYLTGGTALAHFYLKHRKSNDLDFFSSVPELIAPFSSRLEEKLKSHGMSVERQRGFHSFVELAVERSGETTIIQMAQDAVFRFESTVTFPQFPNVKIDNLRDIASNKLLALFGRAALRDFIDLYALIQKGKFTAEELMKMAPQKDPGFDLYWLGVAFERIRQFREGAPDMLLLLEPVSLKELRAFFNQWREKIAKELKS